MTFTNNRLDFFNGESYGEVQHANAFAKGMPNFVAQGLELTGNTLSSGIFNNTGTFGQLGSVNEMHTITANYTGFIAIESTLSGRTSTSRIIESPTFLSTDPRTASNIRYFTIYELSNGSIINDFRHIDYVKSFEVKNIGGSQFVFILNGFVSAPFDASVLAGNRTLINDKDINYDDTIHATTPLQDILKDLFDKSQAVVGNDKPFILDFFVSSRESEQINYNLTKNIIAFIESKYGTALGTSEGLRFRLEATTLIELTGVNNNESNKCSIWNDSYYFEWKFDYEDWSNVIVRDAKGNSFFIEESIVIGDGLGTNMNDIVLNESIYNFENISVNVTMGTAAIERIHSKIPITTLSSIYMNSFPYSISENEINYSNLALSSNFSGMTLSLGGQSVVYVAFTVVTDSSTTIFTEGCGILQIWGHDRIYPIGTTHSLETIDGKLYRKITLPNGEVTFKETQIEQDFYVSDDK